MYITTHIFFISDLIQLYYLRHVSNNQVFILRKTCTTDLGFVGPCIFTHSNESTN